MNIQNKGKEFLSQLKLYTDYLKWNNNLGRYETWEEAVDSTLNTHILKYGEKVRKYIDEIRLPYLNKEFLVSQRNLQFREELILKNNAKLYNCCTTYAYSPDVFNKGFWVLLSGTGLGVHLGKKYIKQLPSINARKKVGAKNLVIEDSIEGWADALKALISSYCKHPSLLNEYFGYQIKFDYSQIRPKGALISGGFKAPGPEGLKRSLEKIEQLLNNYLGESESKEFKSIIAYDILMHSSDAVLSGGVRRSAMIVLIDEDDEEMLKAKTGNWATENPQRARSNNSVWLKRGSFSKERLRELLAINNGDNDLGFILVDHEDEITNPCAEIGFNFYEQIKNKLSAAYQFCNLSELNASAYKDAKGNFDEEKFYHGCRVGAIAGTLQAGYTEFPYLGKETERIVAGEALLGVSITGWMTNPDLFNPEILRKGAQIVIDTNKEVATFLGINQSARTTTTKPSGNASVVLGTTSGIHPDHAKKYFRIMQLNKESETADWLTKNMPEVLEESAWSANNTDYVVFTPIENSENTIIKEEMTGVKHLELIKLVKENWVDAGKVKELCYNPSTSHNISNTVIIDDMEEIAEYLYKNLDSFTAVSFITAYGDKDYNQAPFTSVYNTEELIQKYGDGVIFMSGLIVDGLHYFNGNLWDATDHVLNKDKKIVGTREQVLLRKDWIRRVHQFAKNYFKKDIQKTIYCMKDVHLWHKWNTVNRVFKVPNFTEILKEPSYADIDKYAAIACSGGACEVDFGQRKL